MPTDNEILRLSKLAEEHYDRAYISKAYEEFESFSKDQITEIRRLILPTAAGFEEHSEDEDIHVTAAEKAAWSAKADVSSIPTNYASQTFVTNKVTEEAGTRSSSDQALSYRIDSNDAHRQNSNIHVTAEDKVSWNAKADSTAINNEYARALEAERGLQTAIDTKASSSSVTAEKARAEAAEGTLQTAITNLNTNTNASIQSIQNSISALGNQKQNKLTAGNNITIENNVISATGSSGGGSTYDDTEIRGLIAGKQDILTDDDKREIASLANIPANLSELTNDCNFITSSDVPTSDITANTNARHGHSNKAILDAITQAPITQHQSLANYVLTTDSRLSNARTPVSHTHEGDDITIDINAFDEIIDELGEDVPSLQYWSEYVNGILTTYTDDHINSLIDTKLGVIENGNY